MKRGDLQEYNHVEDIVVFLSWKVFYTDNISNASNKQEMRESHSQMKILIRQNFKWSVVNLALATLHGGSLEMSRTVHLIFQNPGGFPVNLFGQQLLNTAGRFKGSVHQNKERTRKLWNKKTTFILNDFQISIAHEHEILQFCSVNYYSVTVVSWIARSRNSSKYKSPGLRGINGAKL